MKSVIGIDLGGTKCAVLLAESNGGEFKIKKRVPFPTGIDMPPSEVIARICGAIEKLKVKPDAIGISCGGPLDSASGRILSPPNLPLWDDIPICDMLYERFGAPTFLQNDADACALAEWRFGAGRGCRSMIFMTFGTGLGAGLILDGRLYSGASGMAGEVGHIRLCEYGPAGYGKAGSFEGFCSGRGIAQLGCTLGFEAFQQGKKPSYFDPEKLSSISAKSVCEAAAAGDETAIAVLAASGEYLGRGLSVLIDILNPEKIVIGSVFARAKEFILPAAQKVIEAETLARSREVCEVVPAGLGEETGDYAAISAAIYNGGF